MDVFGRLPHSCQYCRAIEIDGTLGTNGLVSQSFTWTLPNIQTFVQECMLFRWSLQLPAITLEATDYLKLSISTNHENLTYLEAEWKDANGSFIPLRDSEKTSLHIFAERGGFPLVIYTHSS